MTAEETLSLYTELGALNLAQISAVQARGDCPLCNNPTGHLYVRLVPGVSKSTGKPLTIGMWQCKFCGQQGNQFSLLREVHKGLRETTTPAALKLLADHRSLPWRHLKRQGVVYSPLTCEYLLPVYNAKGSIVTMIRYDIGAKDPKPYNLTGLSTHLFGLEEFPAKLPKIKDASGKPLPPLVYVTEGIWDYLAFTHLADEYLKAYKTQYASTPPDSDKFFILGSPGTQYPEDYLQLLKGWEVRILFDNDKAGKDGTPRLCDKLKGIAAKITYLAWPDDEKLIGKDIRDIVTKPQLIT